MRIQAVSDLHGNLPEIEPCDLLLIAGDVAPDEFDQQWWLDRVFRRWLERIPATHVVGIAGNHDEALQSGVDLPWHYLLDDSIDIEGLTIYGTPWCNLIGWAFYKPPQELKLAFEAIPECDILMTHMPSYGYGDSVPGMQHYDLAGGRFTGINTGDRDLYARIGEICPRAHIFGHIHEGYGHYRRELATGLVDEYNVAYVDERYRPVHEVVEITLE